MEPHLDLSALGWGKHTSCIEIKSTGDWMTLAVITVFLFVVSHSIVFLLQSLFFSTLLLKNKKEIYDQKDNVWMPYDTELISYFCFSVQIGLNSFRF